MIGRTGTTRALSLISFTLLAAVVAAACGEADSDVDDDAGGGSGGAGSAFDCDSAAPVDGEGCDSSGTICQTADGGVCACFGQNDPSWNCFGDDSNGEGGAGFGFGGRNQGGRMGNGGRGNFGQGGA